MKPSTAYHRPLGFAAVVVGLAGVVVAATGAADADEAGAGVASKDAYAGALTAFLLQEPDGFPVSIDEARCMAEAIVEVITNERLADLGVDPTDFAGPRGFADVVGAGNVTVEQGGRIIEDWASCTDLDQLFIRVVLDDTGVRPEQGACFTAEVTRRGLATAVLREAFTVGSGAPVSPEVESSMSEVVQSCFGGLGG